MTAYKVTFDLGQFDTTVFADDEASAADAAYEKVKAMSDIEIMMKVFKNNETPFWVSEVCIKEEKR